MKYFPWDRLQLDATVDGGQRVSKQAVFFKTFRSYAKKLIWTPLTLNNGALFYGDHSELSNNEISIEEDFRKTFLETLSKQSKDFSQSVNLSLFDLTGSLETLGEEFESTHISFEYHPYRENLENLLKDLIELRNEIRSNNSGSGTVEPPNRKILIALVQLDLESLSLLKDSKNAENLLIELLTNSYNDRLYIFPMTRKASDLSDEIHNALEWSVLLGSENQAFAKDFYNDLEESHISIRQERIGTLYNKNSKELATVYPLKFKASEWQKAYEAQLQDEDEAYENFLNALNDGSQ